MELDGGGVTLLGRGWSAEPEVGTPDRPLRVVAFHDPPLIYVRQRPDGSATFSGYLFHLWQIMAQELGLSYQLATPLTTGYGILNSNGTWTGLVGDLAAGRADLALSSLSFTAQRAAAVEFLGAVPVVTQRYTFVVRRDSEGAPRLSPEMFARLLRPLHSDVWWTLIVSLLLLSVVLRVSLRFNSRKAESRRIVEEMGWGSCLFASLMTVTGQGWNTTPQSLAGRITSIFGWLMGILIYTNYTANLMSFLTVNTVDRPINSLREFSEKTDWKLAMQPGSFKLDDFRSSPDGYERHLYERAISGDRYVTVDERNGSMRHVFEPKVMVYANTMQLFYWLGEEACTFVSVPDTASGTIHLHLAVTKGKPALKRALTRVLLKLSETGAISRLRRKLRGSHASLCGDVPNGFKKLSLNELLSVLCLVPLGIVVSLGTFGLELVMKRTTLPSELPGSRRMPLKTELRNHEAKDISMDESHCRQLGSHFMGETLQRDAVLPPSITATEIAQQAEEPPAAASRTQQRLWLAQLRALLAELEGAELTEASLLLMVGEGAGPPLTDQSWFWHRVLLMLTQHPRWAAPPEDGTTRPD